MVSTAGAAIPTAGAASGELCVKLPPLLRPSDSREKRLPLDIGEGKESESKARPRGDKVLALDAVRREKSCGFSPSARDSFTSGLGGGSEGLPDVVLSEASERWSSAFMYCIDTIPARRRRSGSAQTYTLAPRPSPNP